MSTKTTYVLSKEEIVSKLDSLHFSFEEHHWESFQQKFEEVKVQQVTPSTTKFSPKLIAIPVCVVLAGIIVYFSVNKLQSQNQADDTKVKIETAASTPSTPAPAPKKEVTKTEPVQDTKTPVVTNTVSTSVAQNPQPTQTTPVQQTSIVPTNTVTTVMSTPANVPANTARLIATPATQNQGTTVQQQPVKKYYKRKTDTKSIPEPLVPSPGEDDVVVPEANSGPSEN